MKVSHPAGSRNIAAAPVTLTELIDAVVRPGWKPSEAQIRQAHAVAREGHRLPRRWAPYITRTAVRLTQPSAVE